MYAWDSSYKVNGYGFSLSYGYKFRISERKKHLLYQIEEVRRTRAVQRAARKRRGCLDGEGLPTIAVVGYTNAVCCQYSYVFMICIFRNQII